MNRKIAIPALILAAGVATAGSLAFAKSTGAENDTIADLAKANITITQAIAAAEAQVGGKAVKAELDGERNAVVYKVEVVRADNAVFDVRIDAADAKVLSNKQDQADRGENDEDDND